MLDPTAVALMLAAGLLHASWHSLVKYGSDQIVVLAGMCFVAAFFAACFLPFVPLPSLSTWGVLLGSVVLHVTYKLALARSYGLGDLGQAYPMALGFVPLLATTFAFFILNQIPSTGQLTGICILCAGLLWLSERSIRGGIGARLVVSALAAGFMVACYSVVDAYGTRLAGGWLSFTAWLVVLDGGSFCLLAYLMRGRSLWHNLSLHRSRVAVSGLLGTVSFAVFMWALSRSPTGAVTSLRESSVMFATLIGAFVHGEKLSWHRIGAVALILAGLIQVSMAR